jgi:FAD:protein FMN transferase
MEEATMAAATDLDLADSDRSRMSESAPARWRRTFGAMGTVVTLIGPAPGSERDRAILERALTIVRATFAREEERFSRFRLETEISRVNAEAGRWTTVSRPFRKVLRASLEAARSTGGLFDPTVLPALLAAGYDRDFDAVIAGARLALHPTEPCGRWREIRVRDRQILFPHGVALDFGGIAKGWTVDRAARKLRELLPWALVDAGGDLRLVGSIPPEGLDVGVEDPLDPRAEIMRLRLDRGALATSSVTLRSWGTGLHHLIDPRTGRPAQTGILQATVWARTCAEAEVGSKLALLDPHGAIDRIPVVLVREDGTILTNLAEQGGREGTA